MRREKLALFPGGFNPRQALADIAVAALTVPATLEGAALEPVITALAFDPVEAERCEQALSTLAAVVYARPELLEPGVIDALAVLLRTVPLPQAIGWTTLRIFEFLASTAHAALAWSQLMKLLRDQDLDLQRRQRVLPVTREFVDWSRDVVDIDDILALARSFPPPDRAFLFDHGVDRFVFRTPEAFTVERLRQIFETFGDAPRYPHVLYSLASRPGLSADANAVLARELSGCFPFHRTAADILRGRKMSIVVAHNIGMGQGDDIVRLVPLLQGLLDANPELSITLATWRPYLYDHPRVTTVPITEDETLRQALVQPFEGVVEFFQPETGGVTFRHEAHQILETYLSGHQPALVIKGDKGHASAGRAGNRPPFLHQMVALNGYDICSSRGLDQSSVQNIYEPGMRLLAELGLPQRAGEERPHTLSILTGTKSEECEKLWATLAAAEPGEERRPVALVSLFGGSGMLKGFLQQESVVAAQIAALVDEGYWVVALPIGQPWGRVSVMSSVLSRLDPDVRDQVRVAPDPAETEAGAQVVFTERPELAYRDRVMRAFKYFAEYADLIVTVEGWLAHFAYVLGRPFRLFLAAGSFGWEYHPRDRGAGQYLVSAPSPRAARALWSSALFGESDPPALPHRPRRFLLELALPGLGRFGGAAALGPLQRAMTSLDPEVRWWTAKAIGLALPAEPAKKALLRALADRSPGVMREAADALLQHGADCSRELGARYGEVLRVHADIAQRNWPAVARAGEVALPALFKAADCENDDIKQGAKDLMRGILAPFVAKLAQTEPHTAAEDVPDPRPRSGNPAAQETSPSRSSNARQFETSSKGGSASS